MTKLPVFTAADAVQPRQQPTGPTDPATIDALRLGDAVTVQVPPGLLVRNNESGGYFANATPTPQTVSATLLRRLRDGDLFLVEAA